MDDIQSDNLLTVRLFSQKHSAFPEGGLRHVIFHADKNGFSDCICRLGTKVFIKEQKFLKRVSENGGCHVSR